MCSFDFGSILGVSIRIGGAMQEWIQNQNWSEELWVAVLVAAVVVASIVVWSYDHYLRR